MRRAHAFAIRVAIAFGFFSRTAHGSSVDELLASAERSLAQGNEEIALRRYTEALSLDGTCEPCFLGLGALREKRGDLREAERVYSAALLRRVDLVEVRIARARVRWALAMKEEAIADLEDGAVRAPRLAIFRELVTRYRELRQVPAQLRAARQLLAFAEKSQDDAAIREARVLVAALVLVAGPTDPVAQPSAPDPIRKAIAKAAR